jgi:hypothetical protein
MRTRITLKTMLICIAAASMAVHTAAGQTPIGSEFLVNTMTTGNQSDPSIAMVASGDFVVVYASVDSIHGQRFNASGVAVGGEFKINTDMTYHPKLYPSVAMDSTGNFVVVWQSFDQDGNLWGVYGQRYDNTGTKVGSEFQVNTYTTSLQMYPEVAMSATGEFVVVWVSDGQDTSGYGVYGQRYDNTGTKVGSEFRVNTTVANNQTNPDVAINADGKFVVVWRDDALDGDGHGIFQQRYDASGTPLGTETQVNTFTFNHQRAPAVAALPSGGHVAVWMSADQDGDGFGVIAQRYNGTGAAVGTEIVVNTTTSGNQINPRVSYDQLGGFTVVWDGYHGTDSDGVMAQRFLSDGTKTGGEYRVNTYTPGEQSYTDVAVTAAHEVIVWHSYAQDGAEGGIYAQRYGSSPLLGDLTISGFSSTPILSDAKLPAYAIYTVAAAYQDVDSFRTSVYVSTDDEITTGDYLLYAEILPGLLAGEDTTFSVSFPLPPDAPRGDIYLGLFVDDLEQVTEFSEINNTQTNPFWYQVPLIYSVEDVLGDQGGWVFLKWYASPADLPFGGGLITEYTLWRTIDMYGTSPPVARAYYEWNERETRPAAAALPTMRVERTESGTVFWELVDTHAAYHIEGYGRALPTLFDSTAVNIDYHYFQVMAHTSDPLVFYVSGVDSARSVDDLAPAPPQSLAGAQTVAPDGLELTWDPNTEPDLLHYRVYRGPDAHFVPTPGSQLGTTTDEFFFDGDWVWSSDYYYKVSAVDVHGNESPFAAMGPEIVTDAGAGAPPRRTALEQNHPNPFNPATTIRYALAEKAFVELSVFDARGRLVKTLVRGERTPDNYSVKWDGMNNNGTPTASGVYFYRLEAGTFRQVKKMVLLK